MRIYSRMKRMRDLQFLLEDLDLITEYDGDGDGYYDGDYFGGIGSGGGPTSGIVGIFSQPLLDIWKSGEALVLSTVSSVKMLATGLIRATFAAIIPGLAEDFKEILDEDKKRQNEIRKQYADVFARNDAALFSTGGSYDGMGVISVLFPHLVIARNIMKISAKVAGPTLHATTTALLDTVNELTLGTTSNITGGLKEKLDRLNNLNNSQKKESRDELWILNKLTLLTGMKMSIDEYSYMFEHQMLLEKPSRSKQKKMKVEIEGLKDEIVIELNSILPKLEQAIQESPSPDFQKVKQEGIELIKETSSKLAKKTLEVIQDLEKISSSDDVTTALKALISKYSKGKANLSELNELFKKLNDPQLSSTNKAETLDSIKSAIGESKQTVANGFMNATDTYHRKFDKRMKQFKVPEEEREVIKDAIISVTGYNTLKNLAKK